MQKLLTLAAAALLATAAFSQPKTDLRPDETVLLYAESADSLCDPVVGKTLSFAGFTIGEDNGLRGKEVVKPSGNISNISEYARLDLYFPAEPNGQMIIVCPGGGYRFVATYNEGLYVADWMLRRGTAVCVVKYRMPDHHWKVPVEDVQNAFRYCRDKAQQWGVSKIGVMGFSAGGHLAAMASTLYVDEMTRPDFSVLIYPVITFTESKSGTRNVLSDTPDPYFNTDTHVTESTPPAFLALCSDDPSVPPIHSILYYNALYAHGVTGELHIYPTGKHGWGFTTSAFGKDKIAYCRNEFFTSLNRFLDTQK